MAVSLIGRKLDEEGGPVSRRDAKETGPEVQRVRCREGEVNRRRIKAS